MSEQIADLLERVALRLRAELEKRYGTAGADQMIRDAARKERQRTWRREHPGWVKRSRDGRSRWEPR